MVRGRCRRRILIHVGGDRRSGRSEGVDSRDVDRDDVTMAEAMVRNAHRAQPKAIHDSRVEFELKSARGLYAEIEETEPA